MCLKTRCLGHPQTRLAYLNISDFHRPNGPRIQKRAEIAGQVIDRVVGKNMSMTYDFQQLTIDMPKAEGPGGKHTGSAQWTLNGRIIITSEIHDKNDHDKK